MLEYGLCSDRFADGRWLPAALPDRQRWSINLTKSLLRGVPRDPLLPTSVELVGKTMETWSHQTGVKLDFIRPNKPVEMDLSKASTDDSRRVFEYRGVAWTPQTPKENSNHGEVTSI